MANGIAVGADAIVGCDDDDKGVDDDDGAEDDEFELGLNEEDSRCC